MDNHRRIDTRNGTCREFSFFRAGHITPEITSYTRVIDGGANADANAGANLNADAS